MKWRIAAGALWVVAGWYAGTVLAALFQLDAALAPILAVPGPVLVAAGALVTRRSRARALDGRRVIAQSDSVPVKASLPLESTGA